MILSRVPSSQTIRPGFQGLGAAFYPEHHPRETWKEYVRLIARAGLVFVRMGEFAWDKMEPLEGVYDFAWLDEALALLRAEGVQAMLCTPTASPPFWACENYPDILPVTESGKTHGFGLRRCTCPTSPSYRRLSVGIATALARHYASNPQVTAWQVDNEFGHPFCYCARCLEQFRAWCRNRFGTIDCFNDALCTHFWSQTIPDFGRIPFPNTCPHPGLIMLYHQFFSDVTIACYQGQITALRECGVVAPITTNMMLTWYGYDHEKMARDLDVVAGDHYALDPSCWLFGKDFLNEAFVNAYLRGIGHGRNVWFNEFQCGRSSKLKLPLPGQIRWNALTQIGLGADRISYFRFDTCPSGGERDQYGAVGVHRKPGRCYTELSGTANELKALRPILDGSTPVPASVAVLYTFESHVHFAREQQLSGSDPASFGNQYAVHVSRHFRALVRQNIPCDIVFSESDLSQYRVLITPATAILPMSLAQKLREFVGGGGTLVMTSRSGVLDENGTVWSLSPPATLNDLFGIEVHDYGGCNCAADELRLAPVGPAAVFAPIGGVEWTDEIALCAPDVEVIGQFEGPSFGCSPAITRHRYGAGNAWYLGAVLDQRGYDTFYAAIARPLGLTPLMHLPEGLYVSARCKGDRMIMFLNNPSCERREVSLPQPFTDILLTRFLSGPIVLEPFDVRVLEAQGKTSGLGPIAPKSWNSA